MIHLTVYQGAKAPRPIARDDYATWPEVADEIEAMTRELPSCAADASREEQKEAMLAFGPHRLADTCACAKQYMCGGGPHRLVQNVQAVTLLVLDVDALPAGMSAEDLVHNARLAASAGLIYESPSSTPEAERVRVIMPVDREVTPAECRPFRIAFASLLGLDPLCGVLGAIDPAKLFFAGRLHGTPERRVWRW